jgi:branched-chain amino acid transport system substrate-binding protein
MKKFLSVLLSCVMLVGLMTACSGSTTTSKTDSGSSGSTASGDVINIGVFEPASGENGGGGKQETLGIEYANSVKNTVKIGDKTYTIKLQEVDNQSDTAKAVSAAQTLVSEKVSVVLGSYGSGVCIAAGDTFKNAKIPAIGCSCTNPQVTEGNDFYFRVCFLDPFQGSVMANFAYDKGCKNAAVLTQAGDDYSVGLGNYFTKAFEGLGGTVSATEFQSGETDFSAIMANLATQNIDVLFAPSSIETAPMIIKQARAAGITCPIMAGDTWENETIIKNAGDAASDVYLSTFFDENDNSSTTASDFVKGFKVWLNADPTHLTNNGGSDGVAAVSALGYDAYMTALAAIEAAGSKDGDAIRQALTTLQTTGVTGAISFDENGDAKKDMAYIKTIDLTTGTFKFLQTQTVGD